MSELTGLSSGELLKILWDEVKENASTRAQQAHGALLAKLAVQDLDDEMRRSRKRERFSSIAEIGREVVARQAQEMRADWRQHLVKFLRDERRHVTRKELIAEIRSYSFTRRYTGKNKMRIQDSTIADWMTTKLEAEIRTEALTVSLVAA